MVETTRLDNGLTIVSEEVPYVKSATVGVWFSVGSRNEDEHNNGISHFIEHMLFKGTPTRTALRIAEEMDFVGGQLNAFTDKEYTCYYARVPSEHLPVAADILGDVVTHSLFAPDEIECEKKVVAEEIKMYEDSPDEIVHDLFMQNLFENHPLGRPILGTPETLAVLSRDAIVNYTGRFYRPDNCYVICAGNAKHDDLIRLFEGTLGRMEGVGEKLPGIPRPGMLKEKIYERDTEQVHFCLGSRGPAQVDDRRYPLAILDATMGGGMSSRLFQEIREKRGLSYSVGSYMHPFADLGAWVMYAGTSPETREEVIQLCLAEVKKARAGGITSEELERSKNQIKGGLLLGLESMGNRMVQMGKSQIYFGRVIPVEEILRKVEAVTQSDVAEIADEVLDPDGFCLTLIGPA